MRRQVARAVIKYGRAAAHDCDSSKCSAFPRACARAAQYRSISSTPSIRATTLPITGAGPPPSPPEPKSSSSADRVASVRRKVALLETANEIRQQLSSPNSTSPLKRRFWKHVHVNETPEGYQISLDNRPVRSASKSILTIPLSKPNLAYAIAIEWDMLNSAQEALKTHKIPMTSIAARAQDIQEADVVNADNPDRQYILNTMMRYLDTDTLLCWAPERSSVEVSWGIGPQSETADANEPPKKTLRDLQMETAKPIIAFLTSSIWPGVSITPTLDPSSIMPIKQSEVTRAIISGWISGLPAYELAAVERAVLATKSLLVGARLIVEWSEEFRHLQQPTSTQSTETIISRAVGGKADVGTSTPIEPRFGIESAAHAATLEVAWQTGMWGEVEDTHDVEKEDIRRQLGSAVLLVTGRGKGSRGQKKE